MTLLALFCQSLLVLSVFVTAATNKEMPRYATILTLFLVGVPFAVLLSLLF